MTVSPRHADSPKDGRRTLPLEFEPLIEELLPAPEPEAVFVRLAARPHCLFIDSATVDAWLGRYSFVAADPFAFHREEPGHHEAVESLETMLGHAPTVRRTDLPPFQGGAAGLFSYDLGRQFERLPSPRFDEFGVPALAVGLYDVVVAFDHQTQQAWLISQGLPETEPAARRRRAAKRLAEFRRWLSEPGDSQGGWDMARRCPSSTPARRQWRRATLRLDQLAPQFATAADSRLTSNFSHADFLRAVERAIEYIHAGDVFQVNLAQRLLHPAVDDSVSLYRRLRKANPAPFGGYFDLGDFQIASASPERFLQVRDRLVETRPIKGTRPRHKDAAADRAARDALCRSEKDRAENVMIVDLLRNDLSRVCEIDSVRLGDLCRLETYKHVHHLVSVVHGRLAGSNGPLDLLRAAFPGGSVTGAPKLRAMEIIAELEPTARGPYCGSLGYVGFDGSMDLNILIRTITAGRGWWQLPVGGGIVAQSDPQREYEETWHKAEGLLESMLKCEE
ncbi:MAG: aminodeoxychorismate synthase component I [Pirellulales bacterium]|nr:aminodeoxychorismate synthase component I [Pirellulales bacterium]